MIPNHAQPFWEAFWKGGFITKCSINLLHGEVLSQKLEIACGNNQSIKVIEIQRQGKRSQKVGEFVLGSQIKKGSVISNV